MVHAETFDKEIWKKYKNNFLIKKIKGCVQL